MTDRTLDAQLSDLTNRELDALLGKRLFGWDVGWIDEQGNWVVHIPKGVVPHPEPYIRGDAGRVGQLLSYTADWNGAGRVLQRLQEKGATITTIWQSREKTWNVAISAKWAGESTHESFPIAVALAALSALTEKGEHESD